MLIFLFINNALGSGFFSHVHVLGINTPHRASQGIAADDGLLYVTTSLNESGQRENIISAYNMEGKFLRENRNASFQLDPVGRIMDFGDATVAGDRLYVTLYNWNSVSGEKMSLYSKIEVFDKNNLSRLGLYEIGGNTVEGIAYHEGYFWAAFHDKPIIKKFDEHFKLIDSFTLMIPSNIKIDDGYVQGMIWYGNDILVNIHGPNLECSHYSPGLLRYHYNGSQFNYVETITPPTYGSGQGLDIIHDTFYFVDRPWNAIVIADAQPRTTGDTSKITSANEPNVISTNESVTVKVRNETIQSVERILGSAVSSFLNSHTHSLAIAECDRAIVKTKITNEITKESQNVEGTEESTAIIGVEINKALQYAVSSPGSPNQTANVTAESSSICKRMALKSVLCESTIKLK